MNRQKQFNNVYMNIAQEVSSLSRCTRSKVGVVIIKDKNIVSYGYNGTPAGFDNTCEIDNKTLETVLHAEANAIIKAGKLAFGADLYTTMSPCLECCKLIKQAGISKVYYKEEYRDKKGLTLLKINNEQI